MHAFVHFFISIVCHRHWLCALKSSTRATKFKLSYKSVFLHLREFCFFPVVVQYALIKQCIRARANVHVCVCSFIFIFIASYVFCNLKPLAFSHHQTISMSVIVLHVSYFKASFLLQNVRFTPSGGLLSTTVLIRIKSETIFNSKDFAVIPWA